MKKVFLQGTFNEVDLRYIKNLREAKIHGYLIIGLNSDELLKAEKVEAKPYKERASLLRAFKYVDEVVKINNHSPIEALRKHEVDVYCIGEWPSTEKAQLKFMEFNPKGEILKL